MSAVFFLHGAMLLALAAYIAYLFFSQDARDQAGDIVGQLLSNNNYRWLLALIIAIICSLEALAHGKGQPLGGLIIHNLQSGLSEASGLQAPSHEPLPGFGSWFWWKAAMWSWIIVFVYFPIAFREEVVEGFQTAYHNAQARRRSAAAISGGAASGESGKGWTFSKDFMSDMLAEGIWEIPRLIISRMGR